MIPFLLTTVLFHAVASISVECSEVSFEAWALKHNKVYASKEEKLRRHEKWCVTQRTVAEWNAAPGRDFTLGLNAYADMTQSERRELLTTMNVARSLPPAAPTAPSTGRKGAQTYPSSFDWRSEKKVTPIKTQSSCGSCWAFGSCAAMETQLLINGWSGTPDLSEQEFVDCVYQNYSNYNSCDYGGYEWDAFAYSTSHGVMSESDYSYTSGETKTSGDCSFSESKIIAKAKGYLKATAGSESDMQRVVYDYGVVTIAVDATDLFSLYSSGIYSSDTTCNKSEDAANHVMNVVGWGTNGTHPYWIVRNSWGTSWGLSGYAFWIKDMDNFCGIANCVLVPQMCNSSACSNSTGSSSSSASFSALLCVLAILFSLSRIL